MGPPFDPTLVFGLLLVLVGLAVSWFITAALGGFQFGSFLRSVEVTMEPARLPGFYNRLYQRASELGFVPTGRAGEFIQGELDMRVAAALIMPRPQRFSTLPRALRTRSPSRCNSPYDT